MIPLLRYQSELPLPGHGLVLASHNQRNGEHNSTNT